VLAGVAVSSLAAAVTSLVIFWTATGDSYREILGWLLGSLAGAVFLVWGDTVARTLFDPRELPVGVVTAILGAPAFALLLVRRRGRT
jgi:iron complex transport system permease protein